ncbi:helicase SKI2W [Venturia canescens]|uniref:helicase SKI2W n=1 Tax=Venturia canescens TaxID=32260 RepID=UPI001C9CFA7A|nr:helicase SKI2W [Venturia canescens]
MDITDGSCMVELPFGPPPIFSEIEDELREYIECPERLPIHQVENVQAYWPREPDILALIDYDLSPVGTTLKFDRDPITGKISNMREDTLQGAGETARNSMSMSRAPGPPTEGVQGNSSNFPFWPGGFDEPSVSKTFSSNDLDFENNLRTLAKGFRSGVLFKKDNFTPKTVTGNSAKKVETKSKQVGDRKDKVNLMAMLRDEENQLGLWSVSNETKDTEVNVSQVEDDNELSKLADVEDIPLESWNVPIIKTTDKTTKNMHAEWAEQLDVSVPVVDFDKKVPKPAMTFEYELDTFQKQAILKLEEGCNVFVAAHTSAGKTTVAEYAIALSQQHMTRVIYTSPIKALSNQKYRDFKRNKVFDSIGLITGDMQINQTASCLIMTTEILQTMLYNASEILRDLEYVIFDEVHYINNENRGHVWEEIVILLPSTVNIVMLSATVPNPLIFANWVGGIKKRKMYVISTLKRPVPLEHYLYLGTDGKTRNDRVLLLNSEGQFLLHNWYSAKSMKDQAGSKPGPDDAKSKQSLRCAKDKQHMRRLTPKQEKTMWESFIYHLKEKENMPVVVFTLSRNRCDANADALTSVNLTTETEKGHVRSFFKRCIHRLNEPDRELPQIKRMESLLLRGIGVHHSGILPILKEIIELLFQNGVVKLLFATETFAMGINMPARTVVFDSVRKYDGRQFRALLPTEYIQMAGRAGRRGHDATGTVMIMCKTEIPHFMDLKAMICGQPENLQSHFKITYAMVLNLRRVSESVSVEDMMRKSFKEMKLASGEKTYRSELERIETKLAEMPPLDDYQKQLTEFCDTAIEYIEIRKQVRGHLLNAKNALKSLTEGRVLLISHRYHYNKLAMLLNVIEKNHEKQYRVLILDNPSERLSNDDWDDDEKKNHWYEMIALTKGQLFVPDASQASHAFLTIPGTSILEITNCNIRVDCGLVRKDYEKRQMERFRNDPPSQTCQLAIQELLSLSLLAVQNPRILEPYVQSTLNNPNMRTQLNYMYNLVAKLSKFNCTQVPDFEEQFEKVFLRNELERERADLRLKLSAEGLALYPEYINRVNILKDLNYIDTDDRVTLKGRVALDMGTHELLITELVYRNLLTNLHPAEIAALLSALIFQRGGDNTLPQLPLLKESCQMMESVRGEIEQMEQKYGVEPVEPLNFGLVEVVYEWARAESFAKIMELTDIQEGIIVRCIQQLNDTLRDVKTAATRIGETVLKEKMEEASTAIKRDIVFTASLYTQD